MVLTHDYIHQRRGYRLGSGCCRVRIFRGAKGDAPVILCTELPEGGDAELASIAAALAAEVIREHFPDGLPELPRPMLWIEARKTRHDRRGRYSLLDFPSYEPRTSSAGFVRLLTLGTPSREPLTAWEAAVLTGEA